MRKTEIGEQPLCVPKLVTVVDTSLLENLALEKKRFVAFYFSMAIRLELSAEVFADSTRKAYNAYIESINNYRAAVERDDALTDMAVTYGFSASTLMKRPLSAATSLANLGIVCSDNPKDEKFILKTTRTFARKAFPGISEAMSKLQEALRAKRQWEELLQMQPNMAAEVFKNPNQYSDMMDDPGLFVVGAKKRPKTDAYTKKQENIYSVCVGAFFLGWDAIPFLKDLYEVDDELTVQDLEDSALRFPLKLSHIYLYAEEFQELLLRTSWRYWWPDGDETLMDEVVQEQILPFFQFQMNKDKLAKEGAMMLSQQVLDIQDALTKATDASCSGVNAKDMQMQLSNLQKDLLAEQKKAASLSDQLEQCRDKLEQMSAQVKTTEKLLKTSQHNVQQLNSCLIDAYADSNFFYDPEDTEEATPQVLSGLRQRLGDESVALLQSKTILVVGGHVNTHTSLRELFSHWEFVKPDDAKAAQKGSVSSYDAICIMTSYCSHAIFDHAASLAKSAQIPLILCPRNSAYGVCERILQYQL